MTDDLTRCLADLVRQVVREELDAKLAELVERISAQPPARYLTRDEAARAASVGVRVIDQAISDKTLRAIRRGRSVRVPIDALDEWLERTG